MKVSLSVGNRCFVDLVEVMKRQDQKLKISTIVKFGDLIRSYLFDLKPFIEYLERKANPGFVLFKGGKSFYNSSFEIESVTWKLYWNGIYKNNFLDQKMAVNIAVFTMRQALEIKFKRICGVLNIFDKNQNELKLQHDFFPNFIKTQFAHFNIANADLPIIIKVYHWTNKTIHNAENPFIWELKYALDIIEPFFRDGTHFGKKKTQSSVFGAVLIRDYPGLKAKLREHLEHSFPFSTPIDVQYTAPEAVIADELD